MLVALGQGTFPSKKKGGGGKIYKYIEEQKGPATYGRVPVIAIGLLWVLLRTKTPENPRKPRRRCSYLAMWEGSEGLGAHRFPRFPLFEPQSNWYKAFILGSR